MNRLRILHLGKYYPPTRGGIETVVAMLCRGERVSADTRALVINRRGPTITEVVDRHEHRFVRRCVVAAQ